MADDQNGVENEATQLKRKAIRDLMFNKSLSPAERTKQIQLIMSGKVKPWEEQTAATSPPEMTTSSSVNNSGGDDNMEGADKPPSKLEVSGAAMSYEEKLRARMSEIKNMRNSSGKLQNSKEAIDEGISQDTKLGDNTLSGARYDDRPSSSLAAAGVDPMNSFAALNISTIDEFGGGEDGTVELGTVGDDDDTVELGSIGGGEDSAVEIGTVGDDDDTVELGSIGGGEDSTVELGTVGDDDTVELGSIGGGEDSTVELGTVGDDDDTVELGSIRGGEDSTLNTTDNTEELGSIGDESDLSSLESKSSLTSRNWSNRFRAAALEAKIAAKMGKNEPPGGSFKDPSFLEVETNNRSSVDDESDAEYTFDTTSCFTLELGEQGEQPSSSHGGVGYGSMPMPEQYFPGDETFRISRESSAYSGEGIEVEPQFSLTGEGQDPGTPNDGTNTDGLAVARAVAPDDEPDFVYAAVEYDPDAKPPLHKNRRFRVYTYFALFLIVVVVALVVVYVTSITEETVVDEKIVRLTSSPTPKATSAPTTMREAQGLIEQLQEGVLLRNENFDAMRATDPRRMALDWILHKDDQRLVSDSINLYQRFGLAVLAYSMDSKAWKVCGCSINLRT